MSCDPIEILGLTSTEFFEQAASHHVARADAIELYRAAFRHGLAAPVIPAEAGIQRGARSAAARSIPACAGMTRAHADPIVNTKHEHGTIKFIQRHADGLETESVILSYTSRGGRARTTLCVSSQVGCAMGCTFCETA